MEGRDLGEPQAWKAALLGSLQGRVRHKRCSRIPARGHLGPLILFTPSAS